MAACKATLGNADVPPAIFGITDEGTSYAEPMKPVCAEAEARAKRFAHVSFSGIDAPPRPPRTGLERKKQAGDPAGGAVGRESARPEANDTPVDPFLERLFAQSGLEAVTYRPSFLQRRVPACLRALRQDSKKAAEEALKRKPELVPLAVDAMLIGVSGFFRDSGVFQQLRTTVLPELVNSRKGLRVCSLGCSEGQELYSVAMLLDELDALRGSCLLGVDCRPEAIAQARAGSFEVAELEGVCPSFRDRYFHTRGSRARVASLLRERARWEEGDCLRWKFRRGEWDLLLFRNVAIYFRAEAMAGLWETLVAALRPGGFLVTGKAEQPPNGLPVKRIAHCIYAGQVRKL